MFVLFELDDKKGNNNKNNNFFIKTKFTIAWEKIHAGMELDKKR